MIDRIFGKHEKRVSTYKPDYTSLRREIDSLSTYSEASRNRFYRRLVTMTDMSSASGFSIVKSNASEEGVAIVTNNRVEKPILEILLGASGKSLVGVSRSIEELSFWQIPYEEIGSDQNLGEAVRKIIFSEVKPQVYSLKKGEIIPISGPQEERPTFNFTKRPQK